MGDIFFRIVVTLFLFAILDLVVGVANDAVNFLNSAVGSKAASMKTILIIASLGILLGAMLSNGMMEVTRKGLFNPEMFSFQGVMIIFLAVVMADIILLDLYNTLRLPTSTTVSVVFEILGAAMGVALYNILDMGASLGTLITYINASSTLTIMSGILLSVGISFIAGLVVQYIVRMIFTFDYQERLKHFGGIMGGIAISAIIYFLLIKGIKNSNLLSSDQYDWIKTHTNTIIGLLFLIWTVLLYIGQKVRDRSIPKIIVLIGTFALAMAFAGNDLVNFIGVTMAGYNSFLIYTQSGVTDPNSFMMTALAGQVPTNVRFLFGAGAIMTITIWLSSRARAVMETEVGLGNENTGYERFRPSLLSRTIVRSAIQVGSMMKNIIPTAISNTIDRRFHKLSTYEGDQPAFDMIRASVNLTVASILIAIATTQKLPLSTTYVTFMVAMGAALADGARGRDSAVYRVTGVLTVIGSRFMTALIAFSGAFLISAVLRYGGEAGIILMITGIFIYLYKTHSFHKKREQRKATINTLYTSHTTDTLLTKLEEQIDLILPKIDNYFVSTLNYCIERKDAQLKKDKYQLLDLVEHTRIVKSTIHQTFSSLPIESLQVGDRYVQAIDYLRKSAVAMQTLTNACLEYVLNEHPHLIDTQQEELKKLSKDFKQLRNSGIELIKNHDFDKVEGFDQKQEAQLEEISRLKIAQLGRIKNNELGVRNTMLYFTILGETYNLYMYIAKLVHLHRKVARGLQAKANNTSVS